MYTHTLAPVYVTHWLVSLALAEQLLTKWMKNKKCHFNPPSTLVSTSSTLASLTHDDSCEPLWPNIESWLFSFNFKRNQLWKFTRLRNTSRNVRETSEEVNCSRMWMWMWMRMRIRQTGRLIECGWAHLDVCVLFGFVVPVNNYIHPVYRTGPIIITIIIITFFRISVLSVYFVSPSRLWCVCRNRKRCRSRSSSAATADREGGRVREGKRRRRIMIRVVF